MSLKPVELQIALPRTTEAGKVQNEIQQRPLIDQQQLAGQNVKTSQEQAQRSSGVDESAESALREDGGRGNHQGGHPSGERRQQQENSAPAEHPYKGKRIDLSL